MYDPCGPAHVRFKTFYRTPVSGLYAYARAGYVRPRVLKFEIYCFTLASLSIEKENYTV